MDGIALVDAKFSIHTRAHTHARTHTHTPHTRAHTHTHVHAPTHTHFPDHCWSAGVGTRFYRDNNILPRAFCLKLIALIFMPDPAMPSDLRFVTHQEPNQLAIVWIPPLCTESDYISEYIVEYCAKDDCVLSKYCCQALPISLSLLPTGLTITIHRGNGQFS